MIRKFYEAVLNNSVEQLKATGRVDSKAFLIDKEGNLLSTPFNVEGTPEGFRSDVERLYDLRGRNNACAMAIVTDSLVDAKTNMPAPLSKDKIDGVVVLGEDSIGKICLSQAYQKRGDKIFLKGRKVKRITN